VSPPAPGSVSGGSSAPTSPPASSAGSSAWQEAFWLGALLLVDPNAAALGEEMALLALLPGDSAMAVDLLLAGLASGTSG
jgi:hypothetical protein